MNSDDAGFGTEVDCSASSFSKQQTAKNGLGDLINGIMNPDWKCLKMTSSIYSRDNFFNPCINLPFARGLYLVFGTFLLNHSDW